MTDAELPLEHPSYDHYDILVSKGPVHGLDVMRTFTASTVEDAQDLIEAQRTYYAQREGVVWATEEVNDQGRLFGLGPSQQGGPDTWLISVVPTLSTKLG